MHGHMNVNFVLFSYYTVILIVLRVSSINIVAF